MMFPSRTVYASPGFRHRLKTALLAGAAVVGDGCDFGEGGV